jgi:hypothetical protein
MYKDMLFKEGSFKLLPCEGEVARSAETEGYSFMSNLLPMKIRNFIRRGARSMMLGVLVFAAAGVEASPEISPEALKALYDANTRRDITDADFFGSFQGTTWATKPMLDYAGSPALQGVETAAQAGDYEAAGAALLDYFKNKGVDPASKPRGGESLRVQLWKDKFFGFDQQLKLLSVFDLKTEPENYQIELDQRLIKEGTLTLKLMGRHKNGVVSEVASRESKHPPMLWLQFDDGSTQGFEAAADAFVRAGSHGATNYGTAETLEVCNSGLATGQPFDDDTRWALMSFHLSGIDGRQVKAAKLSLHASSKQAEQALVLFLVKPTVFDEATITWDNNTGYIYSWEGLPGGVNWDMPKGAHSQFPNWTQRLYWLQPMTAWAVNSNDPEAGRITLDLIRDFVTDLPIFDNMNGGRNELNACGRAHYYTALLPHLFSLEACTPRDCVELLKAAVRTGTMLYINPTRYDGGNYGNQGMSKFSSLIGLAAAFPEFVDRGLWLDAAGQRLEQNMKSMVLDDGAYIEHTYGYPYGVLDQMLSLLELYNKHGLTAPDTLAPKAHQLARYLMFCSLPDGTPPNWGEGTAKSSVTAPPIKRAGQFFNDPELLWWVSQGQTGHAPKVTNVSYPDARIALLRESWQPDANVLFFSPRVGGGHYHMDQNSVMLYAYGKKLLNDTGMSSYDQGHPHFDWQRHQTKSHNTVEVDERGYPRLTKADAYEEGPCGSSVLISDHAGLLEGWADGYPDVRHRRSVFSIKEAGIYFVSDLLIPKDEESHTYDQSWHIYPLNSYESDAESCQVWTTNEAEANVEIKPLYPQQLELLLRDGFNAVPLTDTVYPSFRQQTAGPAEFLTLLNPTRPGVPVKSLKAKLLDATDGARAAAVVTADGTGFFVIRTTAEGLIQAGSVETDARCAYVQLDQEGQIKWAVRAGGSMVKVAGQAVACEEMQAITAPGLPES